MTESEVEFLTFNIRVLSHLNLWPKHATEKGVWRTIKDFSLISSVIPSYIAVLGDLIYQLNGLLLINNTNDVSSRDTVI